MSGTDSPHVLAIALALILMLVGLTYAARGIDTLLDVDRTPMPPLQAPVSVDDTLAPPMPPTTTIVAPAGTQPPLAGP